MAVKSRLHSSLTETGSPAESDYVTVFTAAGIPRRVRLSNLLVSITNSGRIEHGVTAPSDSSVNAFDTLYLDTLDGGVYYKMAGGSQWVQISTLDTESAIRTYQDSLTTSDVTLPDSKWFYTVTAEPTAARSIYMPANPQDGMTVFVVTDGAHIINVRDTAIIEVLSVAGTTQYTYDASYGWVSHSYAASQGPSGLWPTMTGLLGASLNIGEVVQTTGYALPGDGGGASYQVVAPNTGTADGGSFIDMNDGKQLKLLFDGREVNVLHFGAKGDGVTIDTAALMAAAAYVNDTNRTLFSPRGYVYKLDGSQDLIIEESLNFCGSHLDVEDFEGEVIARGREQWVTYVSGSTVVDNLNAAGTISGNQITAWANVPQVFDSYVKIHSSQEMYTYRGNVQTRMELNRHSRGGRMDAAFKYNLTGSTVTQVDVLKVSDTTTVVENLSFKVGDRDVNGALLRVKDHSLVDIKKIRYDLEDFTLANSNPTMFMVQDSCFVGAEDLYLQHVVDTNATTGYGYALAIEGCFDIEIDTAIATGEGWGATGSNDSQRIIFKNSALTRIDFHRPFREYLKVLDCDIGNRGITITSMGDLIVENSTFDMRGGTNPVIQPRFDAGGFCDGNFTFHGNHVMGDNGATLSLMFLPTQDGNTKPSGSPVQFITFDTWDVAATSTPFNIGYLNMAPYFGATAGTLPDMKHPFELTYTDNVYGKFRWAFALDEVSPIFAKTDSEADPTPNLNITAVNNKIVSGQTFSLIDHQVDNFKVMVNMSYLRGTNATFAPALEVIARGTMRVDNSTISRLDTFGDGAFNVRVLDVMVDNSVFYCQDDAPIQKSRTTATYTSVSISNSLLIAATDAGLHQYAMAKLSNCKYRTTASTSIPKDTLTITSDLSAHNGSLALSFDNPTSINRYALNVGTFGGGTLRKYEFVMPGPGLFVDIPTSTGDIQIARDANGIDLTLTQTSSSLELLRYIELL